MPRTFERLFDDLPATLALVGAAALLVAAMTAWRSPAPAPHLASAAAATAPVTPAAAPDYSAIGITSLFGVYDPTVAAAAAADPATAEAAAAATAAGEFENAVETSLQLRVTGIVHVPGAGARALLAGDSLGREAAFGVGDMVVDGVEIAAIERYRVLIRNRGRLEAVLLPGREPAAGAGDSGAPRSPSVAGEPTEVAAAAFDRAP